MLVSNLDFKPHPNPMYVFQAQHTFNNGYTVSVITGEHACGNFEVAIIKDGKLQYDTGITDDVEACDTSEEVQHILTAVSCLS